ncbi:MAG: 2-hydroxyglutaryl-CoA dehydratase [Desulfobacterales bacterium]|nr:2-hydroxyglutaryl-CoA dehydratase [Desulfobacterales bacterium]
MSIVAGCDVGSLATKAVVMERRRVLAAVVVRSGPKPGASARDALDQALAQCGRSAGDVSYCVGTGYGREKIAFVNETLSEISCHAKGARFLVPSARSVIDIGGQDCKVIKLDANGGLVKFVTNDKCASGTGRFLEVMAKVMHLPVDRLGELSLQARDPVTLASMCTVWAQADIIKHINARRPAEEICAGINTAMANRVAMLANALRLENDICMTGGVAKNKGVVHALARILGQRIKEVKTLDPQLVGALGAALLAAEQAGKVNRKELPP